MPQFNKGLLIILDGLGDRPGTHLDCRTPLEAAVTPVMDELAARGSCGLVDPLYPGVPVDTHTGVALLMGLPRARATQLARGPVEAAGLGLTMLPGDVAVRCNFATLEEQGDQLLIVDRRAGRIREDTEALADLLKNVDLGDGISGDLHAASQHRAVLHLKGFGLSGEISDTDPGSQMTGSPLRSSKPLSSDPGAAKTARAVNRFIRIAHDSLGSASQARIGTGETRTIANGIICRSAGKHESLYTILNHYGVKTSVVAGEETVIGLARLFGCSCVRQPGFTAMPDTDLDGKVSAAMEELGTNDFVVLHIKAPDVYSHDKDPQGKKTVLEQIDRALAPLLDLDGTVIGITGDHSTDSNVGRHTGDPVPSLVFAPEGRRDRCDGFGESQCQSAGLGRINATAFLSILLDSMGSIGTFGRFDAPLFVQD